MCSRSSALRRSKRVRLALREVAQTHVHDGLCLLIAEGEALHEGGFGLFGVGRGADDADYLVDVL